MSTSVTPIGNTYAKQNLDQDLGSGTPTTWFVALLTTMPADGDATGLVEVSWTGYARQPVTNNNTNFPAASVSSHIAQKTCQATIDFGTVASLSGSGIVVGVALFSLVTGGNMGRTAIFGTVASPITYTLVNGSDLQIVPPNLVFEEV